MKKASSKNDLILWIHLFVPLICLFFVRDLIAGGLLIFFPSALYRDVAVLQDLRMNSAPHNQSGYRFGELLDLNGDGKSDYISSYGCALVSGTVQQSTLQKCDLPREDTEPNSLYPDNLSELSTENKKLFESYLGQKYLNLTRVGGFTVTASDSTQRETPPIYEPTSYRLYLEKKGEAQFVVLETSNAQVTQFEVVEDGSLIEMDTDFIQKVRAFFNTETHRSKQESDTSMVMSIFGMLLLSVYIVSCLCWIIFRKIRPISH